MMSDILQSFEITEPIPELKPFEHFEGKVSAHAHIYKPDKLVTFNYIAVDSDLANSDAAQAIASMIALERQFMPAQSVRDFVTSVDITKAPQAPMNYSISRLFPQGNIPEGYKSVGRSVKLVTLVKDVFGIRSWSLNADLNYSFFGEIDDASPVVRGYQLDSVKFQITTVTDFLIDDFDLPVAIILEGLNLNVNRHNLQANFTQIEDTNHIPIFNYNWTFGVK